MLFLIEKIFVKYSFINLKKVLKNGEGLTMIAVIHHQINEE